jgi:hypothetical protein
MIFPFSPPPEENSPDLTDLEIANAIPTNSEVDVVQEHSKFSYCSVCSQPVRLVGNAIRRRIPHLFWRMKFECPQGHEGSRVFQIDWVGQRR